MMMLGDNDLDYLSKCAIQAATKAGEMIASYSGKSIDVHRKEGGSSEASQVVTEVDLKSEKIIVNFLQEGCDRYDLALLTEESTDNRSRLEKEYFWCVDPLDGTLSFINETHGYSVSIALVSRSGIPVIGVVYDPLSANLYSATMGQGVFINSKPWKIPESVEEEKVLTNICDRGYFDKENYQQINNGLEKIALKHGYTSVDNIEKNGAVLNACTVLSRKSNVYFKCPKKEEGGGSLWDFAATAAIFSEAKCIASDFYGQPLDLNRKESTFMNHRGVIYTMSGALAVDIQDLSSEL